MAGGFSNQKKTDEITYDQIVRDVRAGHFKPVYYLMGEEAYYIDRVADFIVNTVLTPEERDFNLVTIFGANAEIDAIMTAAKSYPMGAQYLVVLVKEAQNLKNLDRLALYFQQVQPTTILIFCHKNGTIDRRLKVTSLIKKEGVLFESKKLYENQLVTFVRDYLKRKHLAASPEVPEMMAAYIGSDLNRMVSELDKLILALPASEKVITVEQVRGSISMTREFSVFEFQDALMQKDVLKANQIMKFFDSNPRAYPLQAILPTIFKAFANLMVSYYAPTKTENGIAQWMGINPWQVRKNILPGMRNYSGVKVMNIIHAIRRTDARSKGIDNPSTPGGELLKELVYFILH